jgi:hypothetical protein
MSKKDPPPIDFWVFCDETNNNKGDIKDRKLNVDVFISLRNKPKFRDGLEKIDIQKLNTGDL